MLQELTENDFNRGIHKSLSKKNLLIVYKFLRKNQENNILKNFYYDDNFYWNRKSLNKMTNFDVMINGFKEYQCEIEFELEHQDKIQLSKVLGTDCYTVNRYFNIITNKLRPEQDYYEKKIKSTSKKYFYEEISFKKDFKCLSSLRESNEIVDNQKKDKEEELVIKDAFIYRIIIDGEICYIGKTCRPLKKRITEHIECMLDPEIKNSQQNYLYKAMRECKGYKFEIIHESHGILTNRQLEELEKTLIEGIKPKFNYEGVKVPYRFSDEKR